MKKSFMFVAVAAAGMLASCSSDSLIGSDPKIEPTQEDRVAIEIGVATPMARSGMTRGTGTVGGVEDGSDNAVNNDGTSFGAKNIWAGQTIKVYMFDKGTLDLAQFDGASIFNNTEMVTPAADQETATGFAYEMDGLRKRIKYYPMSGSFDFWGYRIDDAKKADDSPNPVPALNGAGDKYQVEIKVDGTQDVLGAITKDPSLDGTGLTSADIYSAKAARKDIQPELDFEHLMTRLTFEAYPGNDNAKTVYVTGIKVRPIKSIEGTDTTYVTNIGTLDIAGTGDFTQKIEWGSAAGPLTASDQYQFELMKRDVTLGQNAYTVLAADSWYSWNSAPTDNTKFIDAAAYDNLPTGLGKSSYSVLAAGSWYEEIAAPTDPTKFKTPAEYAALPDGAEGKDKYTAIAADSWYELNTASGDKTQFIYATAYAALPDYGKGDYAGILADSWYSLNSVPKNKTQFIDVTAYTALNATSTGDVDGNQNLVDLTDVSMDVTPSNDPAHKVAIGEAIIAPDAKAYELEIDLKQKVAKYVDSTTDPTNPNYATDWEEYKFGVVKTVVSSGTAFEVGKSYDFIIKVYGLEKIEVTTVLKPWIWGENIDVVTE